MANGIYVASSAAKARMEQLETVSNNLANMMTAGFKKQEAVYREVHNEVMNLASADQAQGVHRPIRFLPEDRVNVKVDDHYTHWSQGNLDETGNVLDIGIEGKGFFKVRDEAGNIFLTRHGRFQMNQQGLITNQSGLELLDPSGKPIRIPPNQGQLRISYDGRVSVEDQQIGLIDFVEVGDGSNRVLNQALSHVGEGLYRIEDENIPLTKASGVIRQGYIEGSNVNAVIEMTNLLSISRLFDLSNQAIKASGELDQQAARDVGRLL